ncbi:MAG TPA: hypothetical protein VLL08_00885 [Kineosporiaceae bacterium]|nr:hypothetical protein [Kineosporiaceae bacterium]
MAQEFITGDYILVLDGRTLEVFQRTAADSQRFHVNFLRVNGKEGGKGYKVRVGVAYREDDILGGIRLDLTSTEFGQFREFISQAIAARDNA